MAEKPCPDEFEQRARSLEEETERLRCRITALENREQTYRRIINTIDYGTFEFLPQGQLILFNEAIRSLTGYSGEDLAGMTFQNLMPPVSSARLMHFIRDISQAGNPKKLEHCALKTKNGNTTDVELFVHPVFDGSGSVTSFYALIKDSNHTGQKDGNLESALDEINLELEKVMERLNRMALEGELASIELNQIFNTSGDGMWVVDKQFRVTRINETLLHLLGKTTDEIIGKKCYEVFSGTICQTAECPMERLKNGAKRVECDIGRTEENYAEKPFILTASPFRDFGDEFMGIVEAFKDITERKAIEQALHQANNELERLATIDGLTLVANRRFFNERFKEEWRRLAREGFPLSVIMSDVDFFKLYNDRYGHLLGDDCLRAVAGAIRKNATRPADLVARYGGEEFVILLPNTPSRGALRVAELMRKEVEGLRIPHGPSPINDYVTLSLGIATVVPDADSDPTGLIEAADNALYEAKEQGRNRSCSSIQGSFA